jgi:hypothetical protein
MNRRTFTIWLAQAIVLSVSIGIAYPLRFFPSLGALAIQEDSASYIEEPKVSPYPLKVIPLPGYRISRHFKSALLTQATRWSHAKVG